MSGSVEEGSDARTQDAVRRTEQALQDPEVAEPLREVLRHLSSFTFDPVGTLDED